MGPYEGKYIKDCPRPLDLEMMEDDTSMRERLLQFWRESIEKLVFEQTENHDHHVLIVCHGGSSQILIYVLLQEAGYQCALGSGIGELAGTRMLGNCERARIVMRGEGRGTIIGVRERLVGILHGDESDAVKSARLDDTAIHA